MSALSSYNTKLSGVRARYSRKSLVALSWCRWVYAQFRPGRNCPPIGVTYRRNNEAPWAAFVSQPGWYRPAFPTSGPTRSRGSAALGHKSVITWSEFRRRFQSGPEDGWSAFLELYGSSDFPIHRTFYGKAAARARGFFSMTC